MTTERRGMTKAEAAAYAGCRTLSARAERVAKVWRNDLSHKDWLLDGRPVRGTFLLEKFKNLDWDKAWVDLGPSIAGNLGPYWHVPMKEGHGDTTHRLYPKVLQSKWAMLILHACNEVKRSK